MKRLMIAAVLCLLCLNLNAANAVGVDPCTQKGGNWADNKCTLSARVNISVDYPLELAQNPLIAGAIDPYLQTAKNDLLSGLQDSFIPGSGQYELDITYSTMQHGDHIMSLIFDFYQYTGGAHGISGKQTFTFDLQADKLLTLDDLFQPGSDPLLVIDPLVEADLNVTLKDISDSDWIHQGTGTDPANYQQWVLDGDTLVFYFGPYQVAAYVAGQQTVTIPLAQLSSILKPEFVS